MKLKHSFVSHGLGNIEEMAKEVRGVVLKFDRSKSGLDLGLEAPLVEFIRLCDSPRECSELPLIDGTYPQLDALVVELEAEREGMEHVRNLCCSSISDDAPIRMTIERLAVGDGRNDLALDEIRSISMEASQSNAVEALTSLSQHALPPLPGVDQQHGQEARIQAHLGMGKDQACNVKPSYGTLITIDKKEKDEYRVIALVVDSDNGDQDGTFRAVPLLDEGKVFRSEQGWHRGMHRTMPTTLHHVNDSNWQLSGLADYNALFDTVIKMGKEHAKRRMAAVKATVPIPHEKPTFATISFEKRGGVEDLELIDVASGRKISKKRARFQKAVTEFLQDKPWASQTLSIAEHLPPMLDGKHWWKRGSSDAGSADAPGRCASATISDVDRAAQLSDTATRGHAFVSRTPSEGPTCAVITSASETTPDLTGCPGAQQRSSSQRPDFPRGGANIISPRSSAVEITDVKDANSDDARQLALAYLPTAGIRRPVGGVDALANGDLEAQTNRFYSEVGNGEDVSLAAAIQRDSPQGDLKDAWSFNSPRRRNESSLVLLEGDVSSSQKWAATCQDRLEVAEAKCTKAVENLCSLWPNLVDTCRRRREDEQRNTRYLEGVQIDSLEGAWCALGCYLTMLKEYDAAEFNARIAKRALDRQTERCLLEERARELKMLVGSTFEGEPELATSVEFLMEAFQREIASIKEEEENLTRQRQQASMPLHACRSWKDGRGIACSEDSHEEGLEPCPRNVRRRVA